MAAYDHVAELVAAAPGLPGEWAAAVAEIVPTEDHGRIMLTCPESPEYWR